jgi:ribose transport system permease protein
VSDTLPGDEIRAPEAAPAWRPGWGWLGALGPYLGLALIVGLFSYLTWLQYKLDTFLSLDNLRLIALHAAVTAAIGLGMTLIMISGGIDLSVGYVVSLVTVVTVLVYRQAHAADDFFRHTASVWAIAAGLAVGMGVGFANGLVITRLKVMPFVATLGMLGVARGLAQYLARGNPVLFPEAGQPPQWVPFFSQIVPNPTWLIISPSVWSVLLLGVVTAVLLRYTVLGRHCYAIGSSEATARLCGVRVERTKVILYTLAGLATGWAGVIQTARSGAGMHDVTAGIELDVIAAVVIGGGSLSGGQGTVTGTLIGALILAVLQNGCTLIGVRNEDRFVIIGIIIIAVAALNQWRQRRQG